MRPLSLASLRRAHAWRLPGTPGRPPTSSITWPRPVVAGIALIFTALVTPFEVAFLDAAESPWEPLFLVNRFVDLIFIVDIVFSFMLVYQEAGGAEGTRWVEDQGRIVRHYLKGWFGLDVISVLPFDFASIGGGSAAAVR